MQKLIRQGDVLFIAIDPAKFCDEAGYSLEPVTDGTIARGAHTHRINPEQLNNADLFQTPDRANGWNKRPRLLYVHEPVTVTHEEHATITLPRGFFQINRAREFDPVAALPRPVID